MEKFYPSRFLKFIIKKTFTIKDIVAEKTIVIFYVFLSLQFLPSNGIAQNIYSYTYQNVTRNNGGGTLEQGDIIEVRALVRVVNTTTRFFYTASINGGTQYIPGSLKLITNEGVVINSYTDASGDDDGIYISSGTPRLRVNLGRSSTTGNATVANYPNRGPGGDVTPGDLPKFYGNTLFLVAYRLVITANYGDIIYLTGNYYNDSEDYSFNYPGIKIIENQALCNDFSSASFTAESDFGVGTLQNRVLGVNAPGYGKVNLNASGPGDGNYSVANNTSANGTTNDAGPYSPNPARVWGVWDIIGDHTGATDPNLGNPATPASPATNGGYMLVVNAAFPTGEVYRDKIEDVCPNTYYEFSAWIRNICGKCGIDQNANSTNLPGVKPNLAFTINDVDYYTTGEIPYNPRGWVKRGFIYKTGPSETSFNITIKNNAPGGGGNDWVLDDIKLATCYPNLTMNPGDTAKVCSGSSIHLSDTVKSYYDNYVNFCWEKSTDGGNTWAATGVCGTKTPVLENGLWTYVVDTVFYTSAADSGDYYRLKVATTFANLSDSKCAVNNSQQVYLKVYNIDCKLLEVQFLNFNGRIINGKSLLKWQNPGDGNTGYFEIERSNDGINFYKSGILKNNSDTLGYSFIDTEDAGNVVYYRLKLVGDRTYAAQYSPTIVLHNKNKLFKISTINPFKTDVRVTVSLPQAGDVELNLCDVYGKVVSRKKLSLKGGNSKIILDNVSTLAPGMYIVRAKYQDRVIQNKIYKFD